MLHVLQVDFRENQIKHSDPPLVVCFTWVQNVFEMVVAANLAKIGSVSYKNIHTYL